MQPVNSSMQRAQGCLLGQLAGDALGSQVEFLSAREIRRRYPGGVRDLEPGGVWNTLPGQPTDDSELALALARSILRHGGFQVDAVAEAYQVWLASEPFDCGLTIRRALAGRLDPDSQANGALMRVSPLGILGAGRPVPTVDDWVRQDTALTHVHPVCAEAGVLLVRAMALAIAEGPEPAVLFSAIEDWAEELCVAPILKAAIGEARSARNADFARHPGWVVVSFHNALWQLRHAENLEEALVDTVAQGGDTDTHAAIAGALLGAVHGADQIPTRWREAVLTCRPAANQPGVHRPRPSWCWPVDAVELATALHALSGPGAPHDTLSPPSSPAS